MTLTLQPARTRPWRPGWHFLRAIAVVVLVLLGYFYFKAFTSLSDAQEAAHPALLSVAATVPLTVRAASSAAVPAPSLPTLASGTPADPRVQATGDQPSLSLAPDTRQLLLSPLPLDAGPITRVSSVVPLTKLEQPPPTAPLKSLPPLLGPDGLPAGSTLGGFVQAGGHIPIMLITRNRTDVLQRSICSLLSVRGVTREAVFVVQDGAHAATKAVLDSFGLRSHQHATPPPRQGNPQDVGAELIAQHFGYALAYMFDVVTDAPAIIVVEDDFLYSPDFYEYFHAIAPVLERDPTLFVASSWNDNGFTGVASDPSVLRRTTYFPGLGWLLQRRLFNDELRAKWPNKHWDHWLREEKQHKGRNIIVPEVPRVFHAGISGTFMDLKTHNQYFARIATQTDPRFSWAASSAGSIAVRDLEQSFYVEALRADVAAATVLTNANKPSVPFKLNKFRFLAAFLGIWHETNRGSRDGVHYIRWLGGSELYIINAYVTKELKDLVPASDLIVNPLSFEGTASPIPLERPAGSGDPMVLLAGVVHPPLPPLAPDSPLFALSAMKP